MTATNQFFDVKGDDRGKTGANETDDKKTWRTERLELTAESAQV